MLLIFFNPNAGSARRWPPTWPPCRLEGGDGRAVPVVVTTGDAEENRKLVEQYGIRCLVLLQEEMEVAAQFRAQGTPMGYRIDARGTNRQRTGRGRRAAAATGNRSSQTPSARSRLPKRTARRGTARKTIPRWPAAG